MAQTCIRGCTFLGSVGKQDVFFAGTPGKPDCLHRLSHTRFEAKETSFEGSWDAHYGICRSKYGPDTVDNSSGLGHNLAGQSFIYSHGASLRRSLWKVSAYSGQHEVKLAAERPAVEGSTALAAEHGRSFTDFNDRGSKAEASQQGSSNGAFSKSSIADEAATHFQQFDSVLQVLGGFDKAISAEVSYADTAQAYENGSWPVLLGLEDGAASAAKKGAGDFEVQLKELRAERATKNASWATEKAEMEAKLEELRREVANQEALLRELQQEALKATETAGPWQGEQADAEERAWWPTMRIPAESASSAATTSHHLASPHAPRPTLASSTFQANPPLVGSYSPTPPSAAFDPQSREAEHPPLLALKQGLTQRLSELRTQVANARGVPLQSPTLVRSLSLRFLESLRECQQGASVVLGGLSESVRSAQGQALPVLQRGAREGRWIVGAIVLTAAAAVAGSVVQKAYRHHREVQIAATQVAMEERMRQMQGAVIDLTSDNFVPVLTTRPTIVKFYTDWCPYCKRLAPIWEELAQRVAEKGLNVQVARLNADAYSEPVMDLNLKGFPSLVLFQGTKPVLNYTGPRDLEALLGVVEASYSRVA